MRRCGARLLAGVVLLSLSACAGTPQTHALLHSGSKDLPRQTTLDEVPFVAQEDYQCGPAALAMSLRAAGIAASSESLTAELYMPERRGSLQVEMLAAARRHGAIAYRMPSRLSEVLAEVAGGTPVIVLQNLSLSWVPVWHYSVVVGYDFDREEVVLRSGRERLQVLPMETFERTWERGEGWAMVALPPGKVPVGAEEASFVAAVGALERVGFPDNARRSYLAALRRWPGNLQAQVGLGNTAYRMKDLAQAETAFREAVIAHPESVAALNNLAQTLLEQGCYVDALTFARRAAELGGPLADVARTTLSEIERKLK